jgi:hypothetical protein
MGVSFSRLSAGLSESEPPLPIHSDSNSSIVTRDPRSGTHPTTGGEKSTEPPKDTPREKNTSGNKASHRDLIGYINGPEKTALHTEPARLLAEKWKGQCDEMFIRIKMHYGGITFDPNTLPLYQQKLSDFFDAVALDKDFQKLVMQFPKEIDRDLSPRKGDVARYMSNDFDSKGKVIFELHRGDRGSSHSLAQTTDVGQEKTQFVLGCSSVFGGNRVNFAWNLELARKSDFENR